MNEFVVMGIGHKARHGKDYIASYIKDKYSSDSLNVEILHWADPLKKECSNDFRLLPLIRKVIINNETKYMLLNDSKNYNNPYILVDKDEIEGLDKFMDGKDVYWGMDEKDSILLQIWGTNFRRKRDNDYWVNIIVDEIRDIKNNANKNTLILIPDTRFINEVNAIKNIFGGLYLNIYRLNNDNTMYYDNNRNKNHISEIELDGIEADFEIIAKTGQLDFIKESIDIMLDGTLSELKENFIDANSLTL